MRVLLSTLGLTCMALTLAGQVVINELIPPNTVELRNLGGNTVDVSGYTLSQFPVNNELADITQLCGGDLIIEGGALIAVATTFNFNAADGEMALYFTNGNFGDPGNIADYVEWGSTGHTRSSVAQAAGIWTAGDFVPSWTGCASLEYDGNGDASTDWLGQDVPTSPCMPNTFDGCGGLLCELFDTGLGNILCHDNGTPSDPSDDYVTFDLDPSGIGLAETYSVSVSAGSVIPNSAPYGSATNFQLQDSSAGSGTVIVTITDVLDGTCTLDATVNDPGTCSDLCVIMDAGLSGIFCDDAGTVSDHTDDFIRFNLDPEGVNLGPVYYVTVDSGTITPDSAAYGMLTVFILHSGSAGNGNVTVTLTDSEQDSCQVQVVVTDPGTCSDVCALTTGGVGNVQCDNNGTPETDADDIITFTLDPQGFNLGTGYAVFASSGMIDPVEGPYGQPTQFTLGTGTAGSGAVTITLIDNGDVGCTLNVSIPDPGPCSVSCNLSLAGIGNIECNDNDSPSDPTDDYITFELSPVGVNLGMTYSVYAGPGGIVPNSGTYGDTTTFALSNGSAGGGDVTIIITDDLDTTCTVSAPVTDPGSCSSQCGLTTAGADTVYCIDPGTPADPSDDMIVFTLNPAGMNTGTMYTLTIDSGTVTPDTGVYGMVTLFTLNAGSAGRSEVQLTIADISDSLCVLDTVLADPGACSGACLLADAGLGNIACDANGTFEDESDDYLTFTLDPSGNALLGNYMLTVSSGTVMPDTAAYGTATAFALDTGSAGGGNIILTIRDLSDTTCVLDVVITDPGPCSIICDLTDPGLSDVQCDDHGTVDAADDFLTFSLSPTGINTGLTYSVSVHSGTVTPGTAPYGDTTVFVLNPGSAGAGDVVVAITDNGDTTCMIGVILEDPGTCSELLCAVDAGEITTINDTVVCVDDGIADSVVVFVGPPAIGSFASYFVTDVLGNITSVEADDPGPDVFYFEGQPAGVCIIWWIIWDDELTGLQVGGHIDSLDGCFEVSNGITITKVTGTNCVSGVADSDPDDFLSVYPVPVRVPAPGSLYIDSGDLRIYRIHMADLLGRLVHVIPVRDPEIIDVSVLDPGVYVMVIETDRGRVVKRIAVVR